MQRQLNRLIMAILVTTAILVALNSYGWGVEKDVPIALKQRWVDLTAAHGWLREAFQEVHDEDFSDKEWDLIINHNNYAAYKGSAAQYAIELCKILSKGSYCEEAEDDLDIMKREIEETKKFYNRYRQNKDI